MAERLVDFEKVKAQVTMTEILDHYGLDMFKQSGDALFGNCPFESHGDERSFRISTSKNIWNCFAGCKGGNVIDFVAKMESSKQKEGVHLKEAALLIETWFDLKDVEYKRGKKKAEQQKEQKAAEKSTKATSAKKNDGAGQGTTEDKSADSESAVTPALTTEDLLGAVMTFQTAVKKVKDGKVDPDDLIVVQPSTLQFLADLAVAYEKTAS